MFEKPSLTAKSVAAIVTVPEPEKSFGIELLLISASSQSGCPDLKKISLPLCCKIFLAIEELLHKSKKKTVWLKQALVFELIKWLEETCCPSMEITACGIMLLFRRVEKAVSVEMIK